VLIKVLSGLLLFFSTMLEEKWNILGQGLLSVSLTAGDKNRLNQKI